MRRDTKFNYGLLFVGLALPMIAEYFLGRARTIVAAIVVGVAGAVFLVSGHTHPEEGDAMPIARRKKMAAYALAGVFVSLAIMGIRVVYAREFVASHPASQSTVNRQSGPQTQSQPEHPSISTTSIPKQTPLSTKPSNQKQTNSGNNSTQQQQQQNNSGGTNTQQQSSGNNSPNITQLGPCSVNQIGSNSTATVNCASPSGTELAKFGAGTVVQILSDAISPQSSPNPVATGFWLNNKGYIATCLHTLRGRGFRAFVPIPPVLGQNLTVASGGMTTGLEPITLDKETDVAILHVIQSPFERSLHGIAVFQKLDDQGHNAGEPEATEERYWVPALASGLAQSGDDIIRVAFVQQDGMPVVNYDFGHITRMGVESLSENKKQSYRIYTSVPFKDSDCGAPIINNAKTIIGMVRGPDDSSNSTATPASYILDLLKNDRN